MAGAKLEFKNLEYIVMEGGGARGAAYLGAIKALETKMKDHQATNSLEIFIHDTGGRTKPGLLDYYKKDGDKKIPVIKGIAGSSAGAITTFALALGFNSDEIDNILKYPFKNFISEKDSGKYRMVDNNDLAIGQDSKNKVTNTKELDKDDDFKFKFDQNATAIGNNEVKRAFRNLSISVILKTVLDGVGSNAKQLTDLVFKMLKISDANNIPKFWRGFFRWVYRPNNNFLRKLGWHKFGYLVFFKWVVPKVLKSPLEFDIDNVGNLVFDRGLYSGFAVREFFMDLVILASTKETHFQREFLMHLQKTHSIEQTNLDEIKKELLSVSDFKIGERSKSKLDDLPNAKKYYKDLSNITFKKFNEITGINFGLCVSNFSSGFPVYFGHEWTPDFRVMEAVAASMSIPPAIKPLYNAADVVQPAITPKPISIKTGADRVPFVDSQGKFKLTDYYLYEHIVKLALAQEMARPDKEGLSVSIDVNNTIDLSTFLSTLKLIVVDKKFKEEGVALPENSLVTPLNNSVNGIDYTVDYELYKFYYNASFKGMLLDGGYRNNIPYNFFRTKDLKLTGVLAIKLDEDFPPPIMERLYGKIKKLVEIEERIDSSYLNDDDPVLIELLNQLDKTRELVRIEAELIFAEALSEDIFKLANEADKTERKKLNAQIAKNNKAIDRLVKSSIKNYRKQNLSAPWAQPKSILTTALDGYAYGSEKGQVKQISDHNHILAIYDYGVGTYDFDMSKVQPQIKLAQAKAEEKVIDFFTTP